MADNDYQDLLPGNSDMTKTGLLSTLIKRSIYVLEASEDPQTIDLQTALIIADADSGNLFLYDSTDTTTSHDGTSCQVDINGRRYKITDELKKPSSVLDRLATPPGSPSNGDTYLVIATATGDWAGQEDYLAVYTAQGWAFIAPRVGWLIYVEDETGFYHYDEGGDWNEGIGSLALSADEVTPVEQQFWGGVSVEDILNTPPGGPSDGEAYLVGTSGTGAFSGHNSELAYRSNSAWTFLSPYEGARVYDKDSDAYYEYVSGAWAAEGGGVTSAAIIKAGVYDFGISGSTSTIDFTDLGDYAMLFVEFENLAGSGTCIWVIRTSADNGSSFEASSGDYRRDNQSAVTYMQVGNAGDGQGSWQSCGARIANFNDAALKTKCTPDNANYYSWRDVDEANNAIRVSAASASGLNITEGRIIVWGIPG